LNFDDLQMCVKEELTNKSEAFSEHFLSRGVEYRICIHLMKTGVP